jgi:hypothetical protein
MIQCATPLRDGAEGASPGSSTGPWTGYLTGTFGERPRASMIVRVTKSDIPDVSGHGQGWDTRNFGSRFTTAAAASVAQPSMTGTAFLAVLSPLWLLPNVLVRRSDGMGRRERKSVVSERGRGRLRELATSTASGEPPRAGLRDAFFVEDVECRQADVENLLFAERDLVAHSGAARPRIHRRCCGYGCSARQGQRHR